MDPLPRLASFWNWLPAFRAVAERLHLPSAARDLNLTPSALSRAVRLLERDLGVPLFRRVGRRLELEEAGQRFLAALRDGMQLLHQATFDVRGEQLSGPVHIASSGAVTTTLLLPALELLRRRHPELHPVVVTPPDGEVPSRLRRGLIDLALHEPMAGLEELASENLGALRSAVWCGRGHPLFGRQVPPEQLTRHAFVAPPADGNGLSPDGWPASVPRTVAVHVDRQHIGLDICLRGELLAVLPEGLVRKQAAAGVLWRLPFPGLVEQPLFATCRPRLGAPTRADRVLLAVREVLAGDGGPLAG